MVLSALHLRRVLVSSVTVALLITEPQNDHKTKLFLWNDVAVNLWRVSCCWSVTSLAFCLSKDISLTCNTRYINGFHKWTCWWCWFWNCNILVNSMTPLSLLTKGAQTITKIVQMIDNSVHAFTSFGNFMKDQRFSWLRRRWIIFSQIMTLQYLVWISGKNSDWQHFTRWMDLIPD